MKKFLLFLFGIGLLIFLIWSRFYQLQLLPASLTHDETVYAIQAKSYSLQGKDLMQTHYPWQIDPIHPMYAEWPATIMSLGFLISENSLWAAHFSSALMGIIFPFFFGWLLWGIWKNKELALIGVVVTAINPLIWQFSRLSYDTWYSTFFYLAGGAIFLNLKGKYRWWSLPLLIIGFFQYQGLKLLLFPWMGLLFLLINPSLKKIKANLLKSTGMIIVSTVILSLTYGLILLPNQQTDNRLSTTIFSGSKTVLEQVNADRRLSLLSPLNKYLTNKVTHGGWFMIDRFLGAFNPNLLFRFGEPSTSGFAVWTHGIFYLIDAILVILGITILLSQKKLRRSGVLILISVVAFSLPNLINTMSQWHLPRTFLAYVMLLILISWGGWVVWQDKFWRIVMSGIYLISISYFSYQYFYRYPVTHLDAGTWDEKIAANYAGLASTDKEVWIYSDTPEMTFYNYLLYQNQIRSENLDKVKTTVEQNSTAIVKHYTINHVTVTNDCVDIVKDRVHVWEIGHSFCRTEDAIILEKQKLVKENRLSIPAVLDSGEAYRIAGDTLCQSYQLPSFVHLQKIQDLNISQMSTQQFCQKWITDLRGLN